MASLERRLRGEKLQCPAPNFPWKITGSPEPRRTQGSCVAPARVEKVFGALAPMLKDSSRRSGIRDDGRWVNSLRWEITAVVAKVSRHIPEDVHELESFAEVDCQFPERLGFQAAKSSVVVEADIRPEFADAAGNQISVLLQLFRRLECDDAITVAESNQVEILPVDDPGKYCANECAIDLVERGEHCETVVEFRDEFVFPRMRRADDGLYFFNARSAAASNAEGECRQMLPTLTRRNLRAVGDRIAGTRKKVREAYWLAQPRREQADAKIEGSGDAAQERSRELV